GYGLEEVIVGQYRRVVAQPDEVLERPEALPPVHGHLDCREDRHDHKGHEQREGGRDEKDDLPALAPDVAPAVAASPQACDIRRAEVRRRRLGGAARGPGDGPGHCSAATASCSASMTSCGDA